MHMFKTTAFWVATGLLSLFLVLALVVLPVSIELTNRQTVKSWVGDTRLLEGALEAMPVFLAQVQEESELTGNSLEQMLNSSGIDTNQLVEATNGVITPEYIKQKLFPVIDGFYDWLEGKTESPEFEIVLSDRLTALADNLSKPLTSELNKLPTCPVSMSYDEQFNPITAQCLPAGVNVSQLVNDYSGALTHFGDTPDIVISSDDLNLDDSVLTTGPRVYSIVDNLPLYFGGLILVFSVLVVTLGKSTKYGLRKLSWIYMINGAIVGASFWILGHSDFLLNTSNTDAPQVVVDNIIRPITEIVLGEISKTGVMLSLISVSAGAAIWLATFVHHKVAHSHEAEYTKVHDTKPSEKSETHHVNKIGK